MEEQQPNPEDHHREDTTIGKIAPTHSTHAQKRIAEGLDDGRERVEVNETRERLRNGGHGINHRRRIHQQLHTETNDKLQIPIFRRQRRHNQTQAKPECSHDEQENGQSKHPDAWLYSRTFHKEIDEKAKKGRELDHEADEIGQDDRDRCRQTRKINLVKNIAVIKKSPRRLPQAFCEIGPDHCAREIKQIRRQTIRREPSNAAENDRVDDGVHDGLNDVPQRSKNRLFVKCDEISSYKHRNQRAIAP